MKQIKGVNSRRDRRTGTVRELQRGKRKINYNRNQVSEKLEIIAYNNN